MRIIRAADCRRMPWKNGRGETVEIAISPDGAGIDDFDWRLSMARVETDGPFSLFAGIDRTLAVLEGEGIFLNVVPGRCADRRGADRRPDYGSEHDDAARQGCSLGDPYNCG